MWLDSTTSCKSFEVKVGDLVEVQTKLHGTKIGTIIEFTVDKTGAEVWIVHIPNHWTSATIVDTCDMRVIA